MRQSRIFITAAFALITFAMPLRAQETPEPTGATANEEQDSTKVSKRQLDLYVSAQESYSEGAYDAAIERLLEANALGRFDLFEYSLGRAHAKKGECFLALEYFTTSRDAPRAGPDMTPRIDAAVAELESTCPGTLTIECADPSTRIVIDDGPALACPVEDIPLSPGVHDIRATLDEQEENLRMGIIALEHHRTRVGLVKPEVILEPPAPDHEPARWRPHAGHLLAGSGALALSTSLVLDLTLVRSSRDAYRSASTANDFEATASEHRSLRASQLTVISVAGAGVVALGVGIPLLIMKRTKRESNLLLLPTPEPSGASASAILRF